MFTKYCEISSLPRELGLKLDCCFSLQMKMRGDFLRVVLCAITVQSIFILIPCLHLCRFACMDNYQIELP